MTSDDAEPAIRGRRWWAALRIALVAAWVVWAALGWWTAPRQADLADAHADLADGRVAVYQWGDRWENDTNGLMFGWVRQPEVWSAGAPGPLYVWRTTTGRVYYAEARTDAEVESLSRAGAAFGDVSDGWPSHTLRAILPLIGLTLLIVLLAGPAPVTGTRWFWWWLLTGTPFGVGLLYWLARERPWSPTARPPRDRPGREPRRRGALGLGIAIAASLLTLLLMVALRHLFGDALVPEIRQP